MRQYFLWMLVAVASCIIGAVWGGYVLSVLWGWFIVPALHYSPLPFTAAMGIMLILQLWKAPISEIKTGNPEKDIEAAIRGEKRFFKDKELQKRAVGQFGNIISSLIVKSLSRPAMILFFGWCIHKFL